MTPSENVLVIWDRVEPHGNLSRVQEFSLRASTFLRDLIKVDLTQNQYDAVVSLTIDVVCNGLHSIAQLRDDVLEPLNKEFWYVTSHSFENFCLRDGRIDKYMRHRRRLESELFKKSS